MQHIYFVLLLLFSYHGFSQTLPPSRSVDWTLAGLRDTTTTGFIEVNMQDQGAVGNGTMPNDSIMEHVLSSVTNTGAILNFPSGNFLFNNTVHLPDNVVIRGEGAEHTTFTMDLGGTGHSFRIQGFPIKSDTTSIVDVAAKDSSFIFVSDPDRFSSGDWIRIVQYDSDWVTSSWAEQTVGQIVQIQSIHQNKVALESPLRMDYDTTRSPFIMKIMPAKNVGIECLKIHRLDNTAPEQSSNINFSYAVNSWVTGIESENCTFSHIVANHSSNLYISRSYFHHGFDYGGGGRAYGVMLQFTSNECLVENNVFEHLRHSMILQAGANGNVFAYNYSLDPYWDSRPNDAAGDMVLHGNYVYANLFEQNICRNIVVDNSHGPNGPYNTVFRNRAIGYGIFFSADNSPDQNLLGNEIPNTDFPYNLVNYRILGPGHFIHGNNNKTAIHPTGTDTLIDKSYAYRERPGFIPIDQWAGIGAPNNPGANFIPAYDRYHSGAIFSNACDNFPVDVEEAFGSEENVSIFPNPLESEMSIESNRFMQSLTIVNSAGQILHYQENVGLSNRINTVDWRNGIYFILITFPDNTSITKKAVKANSL